jgi:ribose transport system ATP-binding protein
VVTEVALRLRGLSKTFGATRALIDVDFDVRPGEIHGLVGRNGSGKSTLIKVLSGYHVPDPGASLEIDGQPVHLPISGKQAAARGLVFVHQDLGLVPAYSVLENIRLNNWAAKGLSRIHWSREREQVRGELTRFGLAADPDMPVGALSQVDRAIVAIVRAMHMLGADRRGKVLVLDEPTAYLPTDSVDQLFAAVREVARSGAGVVFVSHRTDEVLGLTDRITVLRDGRLVDTVETAVMDEDSLVALILGRSIESFYPDPVDREAGERVLTVSGLTGGTVSDFNLAVDRGEVVGITGLMGAGYDEIPYYIFGARDATSGHVEVLGRELPIAKSTPAEAIACGVALLPADRLNSSGSATATVADNVSLPVLKRYFKSGRLQLGTIRERVQGLLNSFDVRPPVPQLEFSSLSGGNQQKALLAKWLQMEPTLLLLHEPTQGVDVGSKADIFARIAESAMAGTAVVIASAEHEDLANLCTRVVVFDSGRVVGELSGADLTEERILQLCYRGARGHGAGRRITERRFVWRPHFCGWEDVSITVWDEPEAPATRRAFVWRPHFCGWVDVPVVEVAAAAAATAPVAQRVFVWRPHFCGWVDAA